MISILTDPKKWDEAVEDSYYPYISYKYGWLSSIGSCFPHLKLLPVAKINEKGLVEYICPFFLDTKRAEIISSPLLAPGFINKNTDPKEMVEELIIYAKKDKCKKILLQIPPSFNYYNTLLDKSFRLVNKICFFILEITGMNNFDYYLSNYLSKGRKSDIKAAWRKGVKAEILPPSQEALDRFYSFYIELGKRKNFKVLEKSFIGKLSQSLSENTRFWIARIEHKDIGSAITFEFMDRLWLWLVQGGSNFRDFKTDAFLYSEVIRYGFEKKLKIIDFGTSPLESSISEFKMRFGTKPVFHELYELDLSPLGILRRVSVDLKHLTKIRFRK